MDSFYSLSDELNYRDVSCYECTSILNGIGCVTKCDAVS